MIDQRAVDRYTRALFGLAQNDAELDRLDQELLHARGLVAKHPEISNLVLNSTIALAEKEDFIEKIVSPGTSLLLVQFLKVLIKKRRFQDLPYIQEKFHDLLEKKKGVREIEMTAAIEISPALEQRLKSLLKNKLRSEIRLIKKTDPDLIGGLVLRFGGTEINASFESQLEELRQRLMA